MSKFTAVQSFMITLGSLKTTAGGELVTVAPFKRHAAMGVSGAMKQNGVVALMSISATFRSSVKVKFLEQSCDEPGPKQIQIAT